MTPRDTPAGLWRDPAEGTFDKTAPGTGFGSTKSIMKMQDPRKAESSPCATELSRQPPPKVP